MSTTTNHMTTPHGDSANWPADLIDNKFDELARKILGELKQASHSRDFFQAVDVILTEQPTQRRRDARPAPGQTTGLSQQQRSKQSRRPTGQDHSRETDRMHNGNNNDKLAAASLELKKQCELIMERQRQQQEQLDNHQQILFDSQYRSLPAEITDAVAGHEQRRANVRASPTKSGVPTETSKAVAGSALPRDLSDSNLLATKTAPVAAGSKQSAPLQSKLQQPGGKLNGSKATLTRSKENLASKPAAARSDQRQRSAIPQSTITSGIGQRAESLLYPITKSATVGGSSVASAGPNPGPALGNGLVRQTSLRLNKQTREAQQEFIKQQTRPLAASEKLRHRRPTKASILDQRQPPSDESDFNDEDDDDEDDDDDEYQYQNLVHRRAFLDQRFINQREPASRQAGGSELVAAPAAQASRNRHQVTSTIQSGVRQASASVTSAKQAKQSLPTEPQVARPNTVGAQMSKPAIVGTTRHAGDDEHQQHEPRSLGGLLTSHDLSQLYKPHMNYSTSLLGNHRLSDDDEIIIIPTAQSPSLMSASVSPVGGVGGQLQQAAPMDDQHPDRTTGNMDELSERFSISRTKSFWEKLANSKSSGDESSKCNTSPQQDKQYFNSSQRSLSSGPNLVADAKGSQGSLLNQAGAGQAVNGHHYPAAMKSAFDRMDSTGGSGNSHYSGGSSSSSTSGDEPTLAVAGAGHLSLAERRSMLAAAAAGATGKRVAVAATTTASINPTINQLVQQEQINRSDRFRRTR